MGADPHLFLEKPVPLFQRLKHSLAPPKGYPSYLLRILVRGLIWWHS